MLGIIMALAIYTPHNHLLFHVGIYSTQLMSKYMYYDKENKYVLNGNGVYIITDIITFVC